MNIKELQQKAWKATEGQNKDVKADLTAAWNKVQDFEKQRLAAVGKIGVAEFALQDARGELVAAESNLQHAADELNALIEEAA